MSRSERGQLAGLLALTIFGCTVDTHQRCADDPTGCPTGFYCDGEWCFPDGVGPGDNARTGDADILLDAAPDGALRLDMAGDGAVDQSVPGSVGALEPADRIVSGNAPGRDSIRVRVTDATLADFALAPVGDPCRDWTTQDIVNDTLIIGAEAWRAFGTDGTFDLCVQAGGDERRFGPIVIDEVGPTLVDLRMDDRLHLVASEPLSSGTIGAAGCQLMTSTLTIDADDPTVASAAATLDDTLAQAFGVRLIDRVGNPSPCLDLALVRHVCAEGSTLGDDVVSAELRLERAEESTCLRTQIQGGQLGGICSDCALFAQTDDETSFVHITLRARRPRLAVPEIFATRPGLHDVPDQARDVALLGPNTLLITDSAQMRFWRRNGGIWRPGGLTENLLGTAIAPLRLGDNIERFAIANAGGSFGFAVFNANFGLIGEQHRVEHPMRQLFSLSDDRNTFELAGLTEDGIATVFTLSAGWDAVDLSDGITEMARLGLRGIVLATSEGEVRLFEEDGPFAEAARSAVMGEVGCMATGPWTADAIHDVIVCVNNTLVVLPVLRPALGFDTPIVVRVPGGALTDLVLGDADGDGVTDALVRDVDGRVRLIINAPGTPVHTLDPPHRVRALRALGPADAPLNVALLHPDNRSAARWYSPAAPVPPTQAVVHLEPGEEVAGVGDIDCDQRANVVVHDPTSTAFRVLQTDPLIEVVTLMPPVLPPLRKTADAVALGDLNGDGFADIVSWQDGELSRWLALPARQLPRGAQAIQIPQGVSALSLGDWSGVGRADLVARSENELRHYHRIPDQAGARNTPLDMILRSSQTFRGLLGFAIANVNASATHELFVGTNQTQYGFSLEDFAGHRGGLGGTAMTGLVRTVVAPIQGEPRLFTLQHSAQRDADTVSMGGRTLMTGHLHDMAVGDFDMDGQHEVIVLAEGPDGSRLLRQLRLDPDPTTDSYLEVAEPVAVPPETVGLRAGDLNGDGRLDLIEITR